MDTTSFSAETVWPCAVLRYFCIIYAKPSTILFNNVDTGEKKTDVLSYIGRRKWRAGEKIFSRKEDNNQKVKQYPIWLKTRWPWIFKLCKTLNCHLYFSYVKNSGQLKGVDFLMKLWPVQNSTHHLTNKHLSLWECHYIFFQEHSMQMWCRIKVNGIRWPICNHRTIRRWLHRGN